MQIISPNSVSQSNCQYITWFCKDIYHQKNEFASTNHYLVSMSYSHKIRQATQITWRSESLSCYRLCLAPITDIGFIWCKCIKGFWVFFWPHSKTRLGSWPELWPWPLQFTLFLAKIKVLQGGVWLNLKNQFILYRWGVNLFLYLQCLKQICIIWRVFLMLFGFLLKLIANANP